MVTRCSKSSCCTRQASLALRNQYSPPPLQKYDFHDDDLHQFGKDVRFFCRRWRRLIYLEPQERPDVSCVFIFHPVARPCRYSSHLPPHNFPTKIYLHLITNSPWESLPWENSSKFRHIFHDASHIYSFKETLCPFVCRPGSHSQLRKPLLQPWEFRRVIYF